MSAPPQHVFEGRQARQQLGGIVAMRRRGGAFAGAQLGRARTRITHNLVLVRHHGAFGQGREARRRALNFRRVARAAARFAARDKKGFDDDLSHGSPESQARDNCRRS